MAHISFAQIIKAAQDGQDQENCDDQIFNLEFWKKGEYRVYLTKNCYYPLTEKYPY